MQFAGGARRRRGHLEDPASHTFARTLTTDANEGTQVMEEYESPLNRAIEIELTFQAAAAQGVELTPEQNRRLARIAQSTKQYFRNTPKQGLVTQLTKLSEKLIIPPANDILPFKFVLEGVKRRNFLHGSHSCFFAKFRKDLINTELVQLEVQRIDFFGELDGFCVTS